MARPPIIKRVCKEPDFLSFAPNGKKNVDREVVLTIDEYEAIRCIDLEGMSREECAASMHIARTTAQAIYNSARVKIADCLVNGLELKIDGGAYSLCDGTEGCNNCRWHEGCSNIKDAN